MRGKKKNHLNPGSHSGAPFLPGLMCLQRGGGRSGEATSVDVACEYRRQYFIHHTKNS